jgi:hypothetical protein
MYLDFPEGRLKLFGSLVFPRNKYCVLRLGAKEVLCEDVLESMVRHPGELGCGGGGGGGGALVLRLVGAGPAVAVLLLALPDGFSQRGALLPQLPAAACPLTPWPPPWPPPTPAAHCVQRGLVGGHRGGEPLGGAPPPGRPALPPGDAPSPAPSTSSPPAAEREAARRRRRRRRSRRPRRCDAWAGGEPPGLSCIVQCVLWLLRPRVLYDFCPLSRADSLSFCAPRLPAPLAAPAAESASAATKTPTPPSLDIDGSDGGSGSSPAPRNLPRLGSQQRQPGSQQLAPHRHTAPASHPMRASGWCRRLRCCFPSTPGGGCSQFACFPGRCYAAAHT